MFVLAAAIALAGHAPLAPAAERTSFNVAWSIYVGWMPWDYADRSGILKKWADKYGIKIKLTQINDYIESINQYTAGQFDACVMTNMDMLTIPSAGGADRGRLFQWQRWGGAEGRRKAARRHQRSEDQSGRALGVALSFGSCARHRGIAGA
jgi:NitT/TauT family transport system substrate-binding protein